MSLKFYESPFHVTHKKDKADKMAEEFDKSIKMTCYSCEHYRRITTGPFAWTHKCVGDAIRADKCPNVDSRMCERFVYFPGSDQKEDE